MRRRSTLIIGYTIVCLTNAAPALHSLGLGNVFPTSKLSFLAKWPCLLLLLPPRRKKLVSRVFVRINLGLPLIIAPKPAVSSSVTQSFEKKRSSSALFAREINLVTQPSFDCEQGINSQVQTACSNADAIFPVLGIVFCKNERFSLLRKTHVPLWNAPRISHVRLP